MANPKPSGLLGFTKITKECQMSDLSYKNCEDLDQYLE